ncbi:unnamed protein product [Chironomus riparius]|uniref:Uncharacterized protein n=1 Tax=Chironomus riparius TaxID=315576 RepID=A0A9P0IUI3_9DIPT|nr:unnamed protein product [Chironomus riparius]
MMDKWKIAIYLCLFLVALSQLSHAETKAFIPGDELEGPNVCKRIISHNVTVVVKEMVPYQESKNEWCAAIPPRCRKTVIRLKEVNKTEVLEKTQAIRECCDGYIENEQKNRCIPYCHQPCGDHGSCISPDNCKCDSGYGGPSCDITCPPGKYGKNCKNKCDCANGAECDPYDGSCLCKKGFRGNKCENTCTSDKYGEKCQEICRCKNGGVCNHISGECYCKKGFTGPLCEETCKIGKNGDECKSICRCQNSGICNDDLSCTCPFGWIGSVCANRCQPGFYGLNCSQVCECFNGASCDHVTGACICEPGFMGDKCLDQCPFNKYGINCTQECICSNGATCDKGTGFCHCAPGWIGDDCSDRQCPDDKYGESCNGTCECEKDNTESCHPHDGTCVCKEGWTGSTCNRPCPFLKYGRSCAYQCDCKNNAQCQPTNGKCICPPGFNGDKCESACPDGSYGQDCSQRCECKNNAQCNSETGECFCKPGWQGLKCERPCEVNSYGQGCREKCECLNNGACNPVTGECHCAIGWTGNHCENKCEAWTFGQNCSFECNCEKQNALACDHQSGRCLCRTEHRGSQTIKYAGVKCESTCPLGYYGQECQHQCNCKNNSSCDPVSGECFCDRGWMGRTCDEKCPNGYFGQNCKERCPDNMPPKTTCDHVTGDYKCRPGYIGLTCDHACKTGTYGEDCKNVCNCVQGECHHVDGICRCFPGWWGDVCEEPCPEDTWGTNCQHKCQCANNAQCRKTDGLCICKSGFMGPKCEEVCPEGFFGDNCLQVCTCNRKPNFVCHPSHGCVCKAGWRGKNCDESIYSASTADPEEDFNYTDIFASTNNEESQTVDYEATTQNINLDTVSTEFNNQNESSLSEEHIIPTVHNFNQPEPTKFTFIALEPTTATVNVMTKMSATSGNIENATQFTFVPIETTNGNQQTSSMSTLFTFAPIDSRTATESINSGTHSSSYYNVTTIDEKHEQKWEATTTTTVNLESSSMAINMNNESSLTSQKSGNDHDLTTIYEHINSDLDTTTVNSLENVISTPSLSENFTSDSMNLSTSTNVYDIDNTQSNQDKSGEEHLTSSMEITKVSVPYLLTTDSILINSTAINHDQDPKSSSSNPNVGIETDINLQINVSTEVANNPLTSFDTDYLKDRNETAIYSHELNDTVQPSISNTNNQIINNTKVKVDESNEKDLSGIEKNSTGTGPNETDVDETAQMELKKEDRHQQGELERIRTVVVFCFQHMI